VTNGECDQLASRRKTQSIDTYIRVIRVFQLIIGDYTQTIEGDSYIFIGI